MHMQVVLFTPTPSATLPESDAVCEAEEIILTPDEDKTLDIVWEEIRNNRSADPKEN